ncbi:Vacuolar-processing enzyme, partial [Bienertia sinuspersici]
AYIHVIRFSSTFDDSVGTRWAILIAGSNGYWTYRHQEKCSFDDPEYRRESVMKHAQRLFRDARSKLKRKFFNDMRLKTKEERLKNKPSEMTNIEWKFLVVIGVMRSLRGKNEGKCSRVDVLVASRTRKSKKAVNALTLEKNTLAVVSKLMEVNKKVDQLIEEARKDAEMARTDTEKAKKRQKPLGMIWIKKVSNTMQFGRRSSINL